MPDDDIGDYLLAVAQSTRTYIYELQDQLKSKDQEVERLRKALQSCAAIAGWENANGSCILIVKTVQGALS